MQLCAYNHPQVCYEGDRCPSCDLAEHKDGQLQKLQDKIDDLEQEVSGLRESYRPRF